MCLLKKVMFCLFLALIVLTSAAGVCAYDSNCTYDNHLQENDEANLSLNNVDLNQNCTTYLTDHQSCESQDLSSFSSSEISNPSDSADADDTLADEKIIQDLDELQETIDSSDAGSTVHLNHDIKNTESKSKIIEVKKDLTIDGQGNTIDLCSCKNCYVDVSAGNVVFKNIIFSNAVNDKSSNGGALYIHKEAVVTLINCSFIGNSATKSGGAVYCDNKNKLTIANCSFYNNIAKNEYGGAVFSKGDVLIDSSSFSLNHAKKDGGALYVESNINAQNVIFLNNTADGSAGAVRGNNIYLENTVFENNQAKNKGGAIYAKGTLTLCDSNLDNNMAMDKDSTTPIFAEGNVNIISKQDDSQIENSTEEDITLNDIINSANYTINRTSQNTFTLTMSGTSISIYKLNVYDVESFKNATWFISNNIIPYDVIMLDFKDNLNLTFEAWQNELINPNVVKNIVIRGNGATITPNKYNKKTYNILGLNITLFNPFNPSKCHFLNVNSGSTVWMHNITLSGFNTAVYNQGTCQFSDVIFENNSCDGNGGAIANYCILKCINCSFNKNSAKSGGAIYNEQGSQSTILDCTFSDNKASAKGNSLFENNNEYNIHTSNGASCFVLNIGDKTLSININNYDDFKHWASLIPKMGHIKYLILNFTQDISYGFHDYTNYMAFPEVENLYIDGNGATISLASCVSGTKAKFLKISQGTNCIMENITLIGFNQPIENAGTLTIMSTTISHTLSNSRYNGAGIYNGGYLTLMKSTFNDIKGDSGGVIYNNGGTVICSSCNFTSNRAKDDGAVIYNKKGLIYCFNTEFSGNRADDCGGVIYNDEGLFNVEGCNFTKNYADDDGGVIYNDEGLVLLNNALLSDNYADDCGGAIDNEQGIVNTTLTKFMNNYADDDGGAIYNGKGIVNCMFSEFRNNYADDNGGAAYNYYAEMNLNGTSFYNNKADDDGGAIYNDFSKNRVENSIFSGSKADHGEDIYNYGKSSKCTMVGNSYRFENTSGCYTTSSIKIKSKNPSEFLRWVLRVVEIGACIALTVGLSCVGLPEVAVFALSFIGGALLAGGEEIIEEIYMDHNFNVYNVLAIMAVAGALTSVAAGAGSAIKCCAGTAAKVTAKVSTKVVVAIVVTDIIGEILTETLPRFDFNDECIKGLDNFDVPLPNDELGKNLLIH